jgi:hypothetical protein
MRQLQSLKGRSICILAVLCYCILVVKSYKHDFSMGFTFQGTNVELHRSLKLFVS